MNPRLKTALAVAAGVLIGMTLFGGALASHALVRAVVTGSPAAARHSLPGARVDGFRAPESLGERPADGSRFGGACPDDRRPMMDPRDGCTPVEPGDTQECPDCGDCPDTPEGTTSES